MKSFDHIPKSSVNSASSTVQRIQSPVKTILNNQPSAVKQRKIQEGINQRVQRKVQDQSQTHSGVIQAKWHSVKGQDGEFEGDESYHHIHDVGGNQHYKFGTDLGSKVRFITGGKVNQASLAMAIDSCERSGNGLAVEATSQAECLTYLRGLVVAVVTPVITPIRVTPPPSSGRKTTKPVGKGKYDGIDTTTRKDAFDF